MSEFAMLHLPSAILTFFFALCMYTSILIDQPPHCQARFHRMQQLHLPLAICMHCLLQEALAESRIHESASFASQY